MLTSPFEQMSSYPAYKPRVEPKGSRRAEVRRLLTKGKSARQIAEIMGITTQAVYDHIGKIRREDEDGHR